MSPIAALVRIAEHYEARSELYTSDADLAFGMFQIARAASVDTLPKGQDAKQGLAGTEGSAVAATSGETPND